MADFDPNDKNLWFCGSVTREEANNRLQSEDNGVFLVRDSASIKGDFVLSVKEENKVSHYIINKIPVGSITRYRIGDQEFGDLPALLRFYKTHYLDTTPLIRPAPGEKYIAKFDFAGKDEDDLPFRKGEILTIICKDEEQWWTARNSRNNTGSVPVPYIQKFEDVHIQQQAENPGIVPGPYQNPAITSTPPSVQNGQQRPLPARARVLKDRTPNAYDTKALRLKVGEIVTVLSMNINGQWEGEKQGRRGVERGFFPFTHVQFIDSDDEENN